MKRFLIWFLLIILFLFSRVYNPEGLPLFSDEAYAVARVWELKQTGELLGMIKYTTQPIFIWLVALFQWLPFSPVVDGRLASGVLGLGTALILAKLAAKWIGSGAGIPAFILMTVLPFSVFYDRTILFESTTLFFMVLALVFPVAVGLAVLTKQTGWLVLPLAAGIGQGDKRWLKIGVGILTAIAVWYLAMGNLDLVLGTVLAKTAAPISAAADFKSNFLRAKLWLEDYLTWPVILMSIFGGAAALAEVLRRKKITPLLAIAIWTLGVFLFVNKTAVIFYPRYLYPIVLGVVLLAAKGWFECGRRLGIIEWGLVGLLILVPGTVISGRIILTPEAAKIPREDRFQFFEDWTSGVGSKELADEIVKISAKKETEVYLEEENSYFITLKSDPRLKRVNVSLARWLVDPLMEVPKEMLSDGKTSLFIRNRHPEKISFCLVPLQQRLRPLIWLPQPPTTSAQPLL